MKKLLKSISLDKDTIQKKHGLFERGKTLNKKTGAGICLLIATLALSGCEPRPTKSVKPIEATLKQMQAAPTKSSQPTGPVEKASTFEYQEKTISYLLTLPVAYFRDQQAWPMVVFLHGSSLRSNDLALVKRYGPSLVASTQADFPMIVLAPQCPKNEAWTDAEALAALVGDVIKKYRIDPDRVYLTGMSLGGNGVWRLASQHPEYFSAIAPVAACRTVSKEGAKRLKSMPIWVIHGEKDTVCPIQPSKKTIQILQSLGNSPRFTDLPDKGHYITEVFKNRELYDWFLMHKRRQPLSVVVCQHNI